MTGFEVRPLTRGEVRALYAERMVDDFPPDELKPLAMIERALDRGEYACYGALDGGGILAYAYFVMLGRHALFDYLAVRRDVRDRGVGGRFLKALEAGPLRGMECVLLEVDDPDRADSDAARETCERRLRFYLRNGLRETGVTARVYGVDYRVLALPVGEMPPPDKARAVYAEIYRAVLPARIYEKMVRIDGA